MKMKRKALAFLLTLCRLFVLIPAQPAAADESDGTLRALNEEKTFYAMDYRYDYQMSELLGIFNISHPQITDRFIILDPKFFETQGSQSFP